MKFTYVDLFSGAGGMSLGFNQAGFQNIFSIDFDENIAQTYKYNFPNHKLIIQDISEISNKDILRLCKGKKVDVVVGGPPCQGFSIAGNIGRKFIDDKRNYLFKEFVRFVSVIQPEIFIMENVARMKTHNKGKTINEISKAFSDIGYNVQYEVLSTDDYGIPQKRRRLIMVGTLTSTFQFPPKTKQKVSIKEAIDYLPRLNSGESSDVPNHVAMNHTKAMLEKMSYIGDGGDRYSIPEEIRPKSGDARKYIKYNSKLPAPTVTGDMRKIFHYRENRALTCRELAVLQTFPDDFIFIGGSMKIQQEIGNAVPPKLAYLLAVQVKKGLKKNE